MPKIFALGCPTPVLEGLVKYTTPHDMQVIEYAMMNRVNSFFVDNGGEFQGKGLEACAQRLGIRIKKTAAYAPWSNGSNKRKHSTIYLTFKK